MRWLRNRNTLAVIVIVIIAIITAIAGMSLRFSRDFSDEQLLGTQTPDASDLAIDSSLYMIVTSGNTTYQPILLDKEDTITITRGEDKVNRVHITPESIMVESATCENQDCVEQGMVTVENRSSRVLGNMIICLPHRLQLYLVTADELREMGFVDETN